MRSFQCFGCGSDQFLLASYSTLPRSPTALRNQSSVDRDVENLGEIKEGLGRFGDDEVAVVVAEFRGSADVLLGR